MVKAQEWLDKNYPKEQRSEIREIHLDEPSLEGEFDLGDFTEILQIYVSPRVDEAKLIIKRLPENAEITKCIDPRKYINKQYASKEEKERVKSLDLDDKNLKGNLDLSDFINLKYLKCSNNQLESLNINNCKKLKEVTCSFNRLTSLNVSNCSYLTELWCDDNLLTNIFLPHNKVSLKTLRLDQNNFPEQDLSFLTHYTNLEELWLGSSEEKRINQGIYNRFAGSLDYLKGMEKLEAVSINNTDINEVDINNLPKSLNHISYSAEERRNCGLILIVPRLEEYEWKDICSDFTIGEQKVWEKLGFSKGQAKEWIEVGLEPSDYNFASYLKDAKGLAPERFLNCIEEEEALKEVINDHGWCRECHQPNTSPNWCQLCAEKEWQEDIKNLTGKEVIEKFVKRQQKLIDSNKNRLMQWTNKLEWIPFEEFTNIEYLAEGGFSKVYKAKWGKIKTILGDHIDKIVILKILNNSQSITLEFLQEIANYKLVDDNFETLGCWGVSQKPKSRNYIMVMEYMKEGDLRYYLQNNYKKMNLKMKLDRLQNIARGLTHIHGQRLVHRDLHPGNILNHSWFEENKENRMSFVADFGLCHPVIVVNDDSKIFGVLPYVAPEVLLGKLYSQASDIYSFGIVAYELLANSYPYTDVSLDDNNLAIRICQDLRPDVDKLLIPELLKDLIKRCWDADPEERPEISELHLTINIWNKEISEKENTEFYRQYQILAERYNKLSQDTPYKAHSTAIAISKPINTQQIAELVEKSQKTEKNFSNLTKIIEQIKEIEKELEEFKKPLDSETAELVDEFVETKKKLIKDKKNKEAKVRARKLGKQLEEKGLEEEKIGEIIRCCESLVKLEEQAKKDQKNRTGLTTKLKRKLSISTKDKQVENKLLKTIEKSKYQSELTEIDDDQGQFQAWVGVPPKKQN